MLTEYRLTESQTGGKDEKNICAQSPV